MSENLKDLIVLAMIAIGSFIPSSGVLVANPIILFVLLVWRITVFLSRVRRA